MEKLSHSVDLKLIFATLSGTNGRVLVDTLTQYLSDLESLLPKDCLLYWKDAASQDGSVTSEGFLKGFQEAMKADSGFAEKVAKEKIKDKVCSTEELESVLMLCNQKKLASALTKSRREVYTSQKSSEKETGNKKGRDVSGKQSHHTLPRQTTRQPINETEVLMQMDQMLRSRRNDDNFVSDVMGRLTNILRQSHEPVITIPTSHPYATIRRSKSAKAERIDRSISKSHPKLLQVEDDTSVKLMRSTSFPGKKPEKSHKSPAKHHEELLHANYGMEQESKSMFNLQQSGPPTTKDMLHGWMDRTNSPKKNESPKHAKSQHQLYYQQHSISSTQQLQSPIKQLFKSTPDMTGYPVGGRVMTQKEIKQAEQYATLRYSKDKSSRTQATRPLKNEYTQV